MSYFYLPKVYPTLSQENIKLTFYKDEYNNMVTQHLKVIDNEIEKFKNNNIIKNIVTPYSLLYTNIVKNKNIKFNYLLFTEIFNLSKIFLDNNNIKTFHFSKYEDNSIIKSLIDIRINTSDIHYCLSNNVENNNTKNNIIIDRLFKNILDLTDFNYLIKTYKNDINLITIMESNHYDNINNNLIILYVIVSCILLKNGGNIIFKIPNTYEKINIDLLFFISNYFDKLIIIRPNVINYFKDEKYICCKNMVTSNKDVLTHISKIFFNYYISRKQHKITSFVNINIPITFTSKIDESNSITAQNLLDNHCYLHNICKMCENKSSNSKLSEINEKNKKKCIAWCISNGIEYNE